MWGLIAALYIGDIILLILNLPLVGIFVRILYTPAYILLSTIMTVPIIGIYSANQSTLDLLFLCGFGLLGYFMRTNDSPLAPAILGFVLGGRMEVAIRQSMIISQGDMHRILERPITPALLLAVIAMVVPLIINWRRQRGKRVEFESDD